VTLVKPIYVCVFSVFLESPEDLVVITNYHTLKNRFRTVFFL